MSASEDFRDVVILLTGKGREGLPGGIVATPMHGNRRTSQLPYRVGTGGAVDFIFPNSIHYECAELGSSSC